MCSPSNKKDQPRGQPRRVGAKYANRDKYPPDAGRGPPGLRSSGSCCPIRASRFVLAALHKVLADFAPRPPRSRPRGGTRRIFSRIAASLCRDHDDVATVSPDEPGHRVENVQDRGRLGRRQKCPGSLPAGLSWQSPRRDRPREPDRRQEVPNRYRSGRSRRSPARSRDLPEQVPAPRSAQPGAL
jgi:hypothetical protein